MSILDAQFERPLVACCIALSWVFAGAVVQAVEVSPAGLSPAAAPDARWLLAQAGGACPSSAPIGVEELLLRQASELYTRAQRAQGSERRDLLQRTLTLIDTLVQAQPDSLLACQARQPGAQVGGIPLAQVRAELANTSASVACPALNASQRTMVEELLRSYGDSRQDLGLVAGHADHALMAWGAYEESEVLDMLAERGWLPLRTEWGESEGVVGDVHATLFVSRSGQHVLAFRGTVTAGDYATDLTVIPSDQVVEAARMALRIREEFPGVVFVGHSMGGRFAQLARVLTGNSAVVFNSAPAGLPDGVIRSIAPTRAPAAGTVFLHFAHARDVVSSINPTRNIIVANAVSSDFELPRESHLLGPIMRAALALGTSYFTQRDVHHNMGMLAQAMQLVRIAQAGGWIDAFDCHQRQRLAVAATLPPMPLQNAAIGATANSTSPVGVQPPGTTPAVSNQTPESARPASLDDALRRASAMGPSVDLVRAYAWLGQQDLAIRTLIQLGEEVSSFRVANTNIRLTRGRDLVNWLADEGRPSEALSYLDQLFSSEFRRQAPNANIDLFPWVTAAAYQKAGQRQDAQRWTRIFLQQYRLPHQYAYLQNPRNQVDAATVLTRLGSTAEADLILDDVLRQGCRLSLHDLSRMASGGQRATRRAMTSCSRQWGDVLAARLAEGLARGSDSAGAMALLQEQRLTPSVMPERLGAHGILGLVAFAGPTRRNELQQELERMQRLVDRLPHRCDRFFRQVAIAEVAHFHKIADVYLTALGGEREFARTIRAGSFSPNSCEFDANMLWQSSFSRMERAVSHYAKRGQTDLAVQIATELDRMVGTLDARLGVSYGARVLAGALALAEAQWHRPPVRNNNPLYNPSASATPHVGEPATPPGTMSSAAPAGRPTGSTDPSANPNASNSATGQLPQESPSAPTPPLTTSTHTTSCTPIPANASRRRVYSSRTDFMTGLLLRRPSSIALGDTTEQVFQAELNDGGGPLSLPGDACFMSALDALRIAERQRLVTYAFNELVGKVWSASVTATPSMVDLFPQWGHFLDAANRIGADAVGAVLTDQNALQAASIAFVREMTAAVISRETGSHFFGTAAGTMVDGSLASLTTLLQSEGVLSWELRGSNSESRTARTLGLPEASVRVRSYYNPWSRRVSSAIAATCPSLGAAPRLYFIDYEVEKVPTPGSTHLGTARFVPASLHARQVPLDRGCD